MTDDELVAKMVSLWNEDNANGEETETGTMTRVLALVREYDGTAVERQNLAMEMALSEIKEMTQHHPPVTLGGSVNAIAARGLSERPSLATPVNGCEEGAVKR